jgi:hypothetical protein
MSNHQLLSPALVETIGRTVRALRDAKIDFAIIGAVALGARGHRRFTKDVDLLIDPENRRQALEVLRHVGILRAGGFYDTYLAQLQDQKTGAGVDLLFAVGDPEESARVEATSISVEGVRAPTAQAEYLVWLYMLSDRAQHTADAVELIAKGKVRIPQLYKLLRLAGVERELHPRLQELMLRADAQKRSKKKWIAAAKIRRTKKATR